MRLCFEFAVKGTLEARVGSLGKDDPRGSLIQMNQTDRGMEWHFRRLICGCLQPSLSQYEPDFLSKLQSLIAKGTFPDRRYDSTAMQSFKCFLSHFVRAKSGQDLLEYALIIAMIALVAAAALKGCATGFGSVITGIVNKMTSSF